MFRKLIGSALLSLTGLVLSISTALASFPNPSVHGIFAINSTYVQTTPKGVTTYPVDPTMLNSPLVDGIAIRALWNAVEPSDGVFNWTATDSYVAQAAAAGKTVTLRLMAGYVTPSWVYQAGAQPFNFIWDQTSWGPAFCSTATIPVPWDPVFQAKFAALVQAFGARYSSNPAVI